MAKRVYSATEVLAKKYQPIPWDGDWESAFGHPSINEKWFITGASASGKSSFVMQLAKKLAEYGKVLYISYEEGIGQSFQERLARYEMEDVKKNFFILPDETLEGLHERLNKQRAPKFIIIDSFQYAGWTYPQVMSLIERFPSRSFIFISQEDKGSPIGRSAVRLRYAAGVKVRVAGFKAYCQGRYTGEAGTYYPVWEEGILRLNNGIIE